jgi:hypothetical protein
VFGDRIISKDIFPHLTPLDYYLGGAMKAAIHKCSLYILLELKEVITNFIRNIPAIEFSHVFGNKIRCVDACLPAHGGHFQHLL